MTRELLWEALKARYKDARAAQPVVAGGNVNVNAEIAEEAVDQTNYIQPIFISYRQHDAIDIAGRLYDKLVQKFGAKRVFKDRATIRGGQNYQNVIDHNLATCTAFLFIAGQNWVGARPDGSGRRIDDPTDVMRHEIARCLGPAEHIVPTSPGSRCIDAGAADFARGHPRYNQQTGCADEV
ncbi:MAG: TIR domain-containing protein [Rhodospirillales bacterium]|nr:TIR domain-containing protein [Rhodospirillales bacterium]